MNRTFPQLVEEVILHMHPGADILSIGHVHSRSGMEDAADGLMSAHTVTLDTAGMGQQVIVYEVLFHFDGTGFAMDVANSACVATFDQHTFTWTMRIGADNEMEIVRLPDMSGDV